MTRADVTALAERFEALDMRDRASWLRVQGLRIPERVLERQAVLADYCEHPPTRGELIAQAVADVERIGRLP